MIIILAEKPGESKGEVRAVRSGIAGVSFNLRNRGEMLTCCRPE